MFARQTKHSWTACGLAIIPNLVPRAFPSKKKGKALGTRLNYSMEIYVYIGGLTDRCYIINYLDVFGYSAKPLDK